jgi:hypothetical protein
VAAAKPLDIPDERPVASGELVDIRDLPEYRRRHGLRVVRAEWRPAERYPRLIVEDIDPQKGKEQS